MTVSIGSHPIGELHFATSALGTSWYGTRQDEVFETHEAFAGLVASVHETYHLMQDVFVGTCGIAASADDTMAAALQDGVPPERRAERVAFAAMRKRLAREFIETARLSAPLLEQAPLPAALVLPVAQLTPRDLLECHAYLHTELYLAALLTTRKQAFREEIVTDLAGLFRVAELGQYAVPLRLLREMLAFCDFSFANRQHPLYPACEHAAEYTLLAFLLEHALHVPPLDTVRPVHPLAVVAAREDALPVCRFVKLLLALGAEMYDAAHAGRPLLIHPGALRTELLPRMRRRINLGSLLGMAQNAGVRRLPAIKDLLSVEPDQAARKVGLDGAPKTFLSPAEVSGEWLEKFRMMKPGYPYPLTLGVRTRAMQLREAMPDGFFELPPVHFFAAVRLPGFFVAGQHGHMTPPAIVYEGELPVPMELPYELVDEVVARGLAVAAGSLMAGDAAVACPLSGAGLHFLSCPPRTAACSRITRAEALPAHDCRLRRQLARAEHLA
ncbi:MAG TPA: hypothetical protein VFT45_00605 [Longimicrobium sp.]|nr:hypothetical protein [Longimicrobium sp.]